MSNFSENQHPIKRHVKCFWMCTETWSTQSTLSSLWENHQKCLPLRQPLETKLRFRRKASSLPIPGNKRMGFLYNEILVDNQVRSSKNPYPYWRNKCKCQMRLRCEFWHGINKKGELDILIIRTCFISKFSCIVFSRSFIHVPTIPKMD